ncbi:aldehyde dehydrogenase family protein [Paractinoplanes ferrugineus]|uniref:Aldehyde dehydrogenase n=1 Tax=Paractinoplanes ferrugineus TaxID=113564 RepID=A0A919J9T7_9ACTN|nr:aldehyde dehydrogenase family protein [Actinoplanes ferrugineus]GIE15324.1 aldehyde dehydrogenase [Actinoplanes ferrugineus]
MITRENPARFEEIVGAVAETSATEIDAIVWATHADFRRWSVRPVEERLALLTAGAEALEDRLGELSVLLARETGKVLGDCRAEIGAAVRFLRWVVSHAVAAYADDVLDADPGVRIRQRRPFGVIAAVPPWHAPVLVAMRAIAPALAAGNGVVVKPSPLAPLTLDRIVRLIGGPLRLVHGGVRAGAALVGHRLVGKVAFTGGAAGARALTAAAGDRLKPFVLTLGGDDPAIFLDDASFADDAMDRHVRATFANGQVQPAIRRLYVPARRLTDFVTAYQAAAERVLVTGDPLADGVTMGPVISAAAQEAAAAARRGTFVDLGLFDADEKAGYFVRPALLVEPAPGEAGPIPPYAPVVPVFGYEDEMSVLDVGDPGLSASIWSADQERAVAFARRFEAASCSVNSHHRTGATGLHDYVRTQVVHAPGGG